MPSARALRAGKAVVELSLTGSKKVQAGLRKIEEVAGKIGDGFLTVGRNLAAVGGAITGPFAGAVAYFNAFGDTLQKTADRTGLSVESLSELGYAAEQSGASLQVVEKGIRGMSRMILDAERGLSTATDNLTDLGLTLDDIKGKNPEEQFLLIAGKIAEIEDPTRRAALAMKAFGKSGVELLPMLAGGIEGVDALRERARELGLVMSGEDAQAAVLLGDLFADLWEQANRVLFVMGAAVAGPLTQFAEGAIKIGTQVAAWANANRQLLATVAAIGVAITAAGGAIVGVGLAFKLVAVAAGGFAALIGVVTTVATALLSPIGLLVAGLTGLAAWFLSSTETGKAFVANLTAGFGELWQTAQTTFEGIKNALAAGDLQAAGEVLWSGLRLLWLQGTQYLRETWHTSTAWILKLWHGSVIGIAKFFTSLTENIGRGWSHTTQFLGDAWDLFVGGFQKAWNSTVAFFEKTWLRIKGLFGGDVAGELERVNRELEAANQKVDNATVDRVGQRAKREEEERQASRDRQQGTINELDAELARRLERVDDGTQGKIDEARRNLEEARQGLAKASESAAALAEATKTDAAAKSAEVEAAIGGAAKFAGSTPAVGALFDVRNAAQMFGGRDREEELLTQIAENTDPKRQRNQALEVV